MKRTYYITGLIFISIILSVSSCSTKQIAQQTPLKMLPDTFVYSKDTLTLADSKWNQYFTDTSLLTLIDTALKNNLDVLMAIQRIEAAKSDVLFKKGALLPTLGGVANAGQQKFGKYTMDGAGNNGLIIHNNQIIPEHLPDYYIGLQSSWEIDVWGKLRNQKKAAVARFLGSVEAKNLVVTNIISEVSGAYYDLLALDNELEIINKTILLQEKAFEYTKVQKQAGTSNELAIKQFEAQLLNSKSLKINILQQISECENRLNFLLGRFPQSIARDRLSFNKPIPNQLKVGIPAHLLQNRPDIKQAEFEVIAAKADVKAAKASFYPSLNINGNAGFQAFRTSLLFISPESFAYSVFGGLTAPLINRSALKAEFRRANATQLEALYNYQKSIINGYVEVYNEVVDIKNLEQVYNLKSMENDALTQSVEISSELFKTGRANYLEVLISQQKALDANLELINAKKMQFYSMINIYKSLGGGWE